MTDLCGSSENIISIVNYTLRKGLVDDNDDNNDNTNMMSSVPTTSTNTNQIMSKECSESGNDIDNDKSGENSHNDNNNHDGNSTNNNNNPTDVQDNQKKTGDNDDNDNKDDNNDDNNNENNQDKVDEESNQDDIIAPVSDLSDTNRRIWVVTTAGLPWRYVPGIFPIGLFSFPAFPVGLVSWSDHQPRFCSFSF
jgi:hypothetical protein